MDNIALCNYVSDVYKSNNYVYIYGTFGQTVTNNLINEKHAQYPTYMTSNRVTVASRNYIGKKCVDCSGLIKSAFFTNCDINAVPKYNPKYDKNASMLYGLCDNRKSVKSATHLKRGTLVFNSTLTHVGVYIGDGSVIEANSFDKGIIKSDLKSWALCGELSLITYKDDNMYMVTGDVLNIRKDTTDNTIVGTFKRGDTFEVLDSETWLKTSRGWVCAKYTKKI